MATEGQTNSKPAGEGGPPPTTVLGGEPNTPDKNSTNAAGAADGAGKQPAGDKKPPEQKAQDGQNKPDGSKGTEGKPAEGAPAEIEVKLPDGVQADAEFLNGFKAVAKEAGLKSESAQKLVDFYAKAQADAFKKAVEADQQQVKEWLTASEKDQEIGGKDWKANQAIALKAITKFGTPELRGLFNQTGLGNHPELLRFAVRIGKALAEDSVGDTGAAGEAGAGGDKFLDIYTHPTSKTLKE